MKKTMNNTDDVPITFIDKVMDETDEYKFIKEFRITGLAERDVLLAHENNIYHLFTASDGWVGLDCDRKNPSIIEVKHGDSNGWGDALEEFKDLYSKQYDRIHIFKKDRFIVTVKRGDFLSLCDCLVDENNKVLSKGYLDIHVCGDYCVAESFDGIQIQYGLIDKNGKEIMPCRYDIPFFNRISEDNKRVPFRCKGKIGVMDFSGRIVVEPDYNKVYTEDRDFIIAISGKKDEEQSFLYTLDGTLLLHGNGQCYMGSPAGKLIAYGDGFAEVYSIQYKKRGLKDKGYYSDIADKEIRHSSISSKVSYEVTTMEMCGGPIWKQTAEMIRRAWKNENRDELETEILKILVNKDYSEKEIIKELRILMKQYI